MKFLKRAWIEISREKVLFNYLQVKSLLSPGVRIMAVLKANAYNCGDVELANILAEIDNSVQFAVSNIREAIRIRESGIQNPILILGYTPPENLDALFRYDLTQTIVSFEYAKELLNRLESMKKTLKVHIKLDTGMGRIGLVCYDDMFEDACEKIRYLCSKNFLQIEGSFTHISTLYENDEVSKAYAQLQFERFLAIIQAMKKESIDLGLLHCLNSAGTANMPQSMQLDMVRTGTVLYGVLPKIYNHSGLTFKPIAKIKACVAKVSKIKEGTFIGYSRAYCAPKDMTAAVLTIGYSDILRIGKGQGYVILNDTLCPVIGGACMDQLIVNISDAGEVKAGDTAILFGRDNTQEITISSLARFLDCGEEEIYCHITARPDRIYVD